MLPSSCSAPGGFSTAASGADNAIALQHAIARRRRVSVTCPGVYDIAATIFVHNGTQLSFGGGVFLRKVRAGPRPFAHVFLNQGAITREYDEQITIDGLSLLVNGVDAAEEDLLIPGLRGQLALFYVRNARITKFRCLDLGAWQFAIHVCTFDRLAIRDVVVHGRKDGIHLGRGRAFEIRDYEAKTFDDAIALNAEVSAPLAHRSRTRALAPSCATHRVHPPFAALQGLLYEQSGAWVD